MSVPELSVEHYRQLLRETRELYSASARLIVREHPELAPSGTDFVELLDDLHRGLVLRVFFEVAKADHQWTAGEYDLAVELCDHLWGDRLKGAELNKVLRFAGEKADQLAWSTLVRPFARLAPLRDQKPGLETLIIRQSNLVARIDGVLAASEQAAIERVTKALQKQLGGNARVDRAATGGEKGAFPAGEVTSERPPTSQAMETIPSEPRRESPAEPSASDSGPPEQDPSARSLDAVLADLDGLIGLAQAKQELRSLSNYIAMQRRRDEAGLPSTEISLHLVFSGNPGTGKTTVARLFGEAMRAMGVLSTGQIVETDRTGLVAEYAGQTGPKANQKIDEALGGVLFIDEAYGLVSTESDDPFGREAVQALLKRAEDDRDRLAVVLAGYPNEMEGLLATNPGLASRFSRTIHFEDYTPLELCQIFGRLMEKHHYQLTPAGRLQVARAINALHSARDQHFGNGRAVRNLFEQSILQMANRLATLAEITNEGLVTLDADDIPSLGPTGQAEPPTRLRIVCPECGLVKEAKASLLGSPLKCPQCDHRFTAEWCDLLA